MLIENKIQEKELFIDETLDTLGSADISVENKWGEGYAYITINRDNAIDIIKHLTKLFVITNSEI